MHLAAAHPQTLKAIPDGIPGIRATLAHMSQYVREYKKDPLIKNLARELTLHLPQKAFRAEAQALFEFVRDQIRYQWDIADVETVQTPLVTLEARVGDCDDKATLLATLLESIGHKTRFMAVGLTLGQVEHVYVETKVGADWVPMDATEPVPMGWEPPGIVQRIPWHN